MKLPAPSRSAEGFTLIELLTVITIIAILMAMLFPFINGARESAKKKKAEQDTRTIVHAVEQYNVEYGQYPKVNPAATPPTGAIPDDAVGDQQYAGMTMDNAALFNTLRDIDRTPNGDHAQNPRRMVFLDGKPVAKPEKPREGFLDVSSSAGTQGSFYDPWGVQYNVVLDSNSDNVIEVENYYEDFATELAPRVSAGAFSLGKDKMLGTKGDKKYKNGDEYSDDLLSWASH
jgi:prepilin-type N-terminal cleavage/methylation domain-containing protein